MICLKFLQNGSKKLGILSRKFSDNTYISVNTHILWINHARCRKHVLIHSKNTLITIAMTSLDFIFHLMWKITMSFDTYVSFLSYFYCDISRATVNKKPFQRYVTDRSEIGQHDYDVHLCNYEIMWKSTLISPINLSIMSVTKLAHNESWVSKTVFRCKLSFASSFFGFFLMIYFNNYFHFYSYKNERK